VRVEEAADVSEKLDGHGRFPRGLRYGEGGIFRADFGGVHDLENFCDELFPGWNGGLHLALIYDFWAFLARKSRILVRHVIAKDRT
jgi:hypothetical protein